MDNSEFPPNSEASKQIKPEVVKNIERVTSGDVTRKRRSLRKQFSDVFVGGNARIAIQYAIMDILLPAAQDTIVETLQQGIEMLFKGDARRRRGGATPPSSGPYGYVDYARRSTFGYSRLPSAQRALSRAARSRHNFDEIVLDDRTEAEQVIDQLFEIVGSYESATVADLYELVGLTPSHTDNKWGWTDLTGAGVSRIRGGYLLDLPEPYPLN
jgi:hypothetical protein